MSQTLREKIEGVFGALERKAAIADERTFYLLHEHNLWSEDGTYTFPDGEVWHQDGKITRQNP